MRIGQNPAKFVDSLPQPERVTVAIITYIPFLEGYYREGLVVLKACLGSLLANTSQPYDLMVFDQASCEPVRHYLLEQHEAGNIQFLSFSEKNLGKAAAWNFVFGAAPGEIIAYADADIYFEPGWLGALVGVLDKYPQAGMVTGIPMWSPARHSTATANWAETTEGVELQRGKLLAWEDYWKHARSLGQDETTARENFDGQEDLLMIDHRNPSPEKFFVGAGHFQFLAPKSVLNEMLPIPADRPMGQVRRLDDAVNAGGYLRLSTPNWWVRHMGNTLSGSSQKGVMQKKNTYQPGKPPLRGPVRRIVQWLYHKTFELLYRS